ncbi:hypothetical protein [Kribbella solani]|uniref:Uncharacterized protein n=1 Tax=Kribbella solani TaxID=236067 RepID=A0A841DTH9_9ACTN|nr:hypothetical protein [Kribbella solani]MBB5979617.1 hypothetical protein [Kribbella solani]
MTTDKVPTVRIHPPRRMPMHQQHKAVPHQHTNRNPHPFNHNPTLTANTLPQPLDRCGWIICKVEDPERGRIAAAWVRALMLLIARDRRTRIDPRQRCSNALLIRGLEFDSHVRELRSAPPNLDIQNHGIRSCMNTRAQEVLGRVSPGRQLDHRDPPVASTHRSDHPEPRHRLPGELTPPHAQ